MPNQNLQIMVVEDDQIVAMDLKNQLIDLGYHISKLAASGEDALKYAEGTPPDLAVMDINLAGTLDGIETAKRLRNNFQTQVVYLTAYTNENILERAQSTEPLGYLVKPFSCPELKATLKMATFKMLAEKEKIRTHAVQEDILHKSQRVAATYQQSYEDLESRYVQLNEFWRTLTQEIQEPLADILHFADWLLEPHSEEEKLDVALRIKQAGQQTFSLMYDIRSLFLETDLKESGIVLKSCDFRNIASETIKNINFFAEMKDIRLINQISSSLYYPFCAVQADPERISQVLLILLSNAIKFTPRYKKVVLSAIPTVNGLQVAVMDSGPGISTDTIPKVFDLVERYRTPGTEGETGNGLGLKIAQRYLKAHHTGLEISSSREQGSRFSFTLPWNREEEF